MVGQVQHDLVLAASRGDHEAFEALATGSYGRLYTVARLILRDTYLAEDAVQEALTNAWRYLPTLREPERFDAWTYRLLVNACADASRAHRRATTDIRVVRPMTVVDDASGWIADRDQIDRGFRRLRPEHRTALVFHFYLGMSAVEIAEVLGSPVGTIKSRIHYATAMMRSALEADDRDVAVGGTR